MNARFYKFLILFTLISSYSLAQDFEGKVVFQNTYTSKISNFTSEQFTSMMGSVQEYLTKEGNYKSLSNGTLFQWQIYINKDNKLYTKMANSPAVLWNDGAVNANEVIKSEINKNAITTLGYSCDELILTTKTGVEKYYFSSKLKVNPKLFENHKYGNWSEVILKTNALPIKMIIDNPQFSMECTATTITPLKLDNKEFELPAGSKLEKSPY